MYLSDKNNLHIETSATGARINTLQIGSKHFFYPQQFIERDGGVVSRGGMHICSPVFGPAEGKGIFSKAPQHGELRDLLWTGHSDETAERVSYALPYNKWGASLVYCVKYLVGKNQIITHAEIGNLGSNVNDVELAWHPYFNAPEGGKIMFIDSEIPIIEIKGAYESKIFPACSTIVISLPGIGKVEMFLGNGFADGYVCVWTDWRHKYLCVEPFLTGISISPKESVSAVFTMKFHAE